MTIPIRLPTHYSLGHGAAPPAEIADRTVARGGTAAVLTDLETLAAAVEFQERCRAAGVRPALGVELRRGFTSDGARGSPGVRAGRLILLARNSAGWRSLCRIVSRRRSEPGVAADPVSDVLAEPEGLIALSDDPGPVLRLLRAGVSRESLRLLLVRPARAADAEGHVLEASRRHGLRLVADLDAQIAVPSDAPAIRLSLALRLGVRARAFASLPIRPLPDPAIENALFADIPSAVEGAEALIEDCAAGVPRATGLPAPDLRPDGTADRMLAERANRALGNARAEGRLGSSAHAERLARELEVIARTRLAEWFLAVAEIVDQARRTRIPVLSRGSAVGSILVHLLAAGPVDPVAEGLLFERFLRPGRGSPPDIDLDLPSRRRDELVAWVLRRWGSRAAAVGAHQRFRFRSARREAARATGMPADIDPGRLPPGWERLLDAPRGLAAHPGGVVLSRDPVSDRVPLERAPKGVPVTQLDGHALETLGFVKLDLLGNRSLDVIDRTIELVSRRGEPDARRLVERGMAGIPQDDAPTIARLDRAETIGCSQIESPATRAALARRRIGSIEDLTAAIAAVRPGPAGSGLLFEEEVMRLLAGAGSMSLEEADGWRAEIVETAEDPSALSALGQRFVACAAGRGSDPRLASRAWASAAKLARYAFSKAHASSAAYLAIRAAYLRTHVPVEYGCAVLDEHGGAYLRRTIAGEVARWGTAVLAPCVNRSELRTAPDREGRIRLGLVRIRGLRGTTVARILEERSRGAFRNTRELLRRVIPTSRELEALIRSGACDDLDPLSAAAHPFAHEAVLAAVRAGRDPTAWGEPFRRLARRAAADPDLQRYRSLVRARDELRFLGCAPSGHPLAPLRARAEAIGCRTIAEVRSLGRLGREVRIVGLAAATHGVETARGPMRFVTWEDETGLLEAQLPPEGWARTGARFASDRPFLLRGRLRPGPPIALLVTDLSPFPTAAANALRVSRRTATQGARV